MVNRRTNNETLATLRREIIAAGSMLAAVTLGTMIVMWVLT